MKKQIKVLQVFASLNMGGAESRMMDVYRKIDKEKINFDFLTMQEDKQYFEDEILSIGGKIIKIKPPRERGSFGNFSDIKRVLKVGNYDAVHAHTSFHCGLVCLAAFFAGIKIRIAHARTTGSKNPSFKNKIALILGRSLIALFSTKRLAISKMSGEYLFGNSEFEVMPNANDLDKYEHVTVEETEHIKTEFDLHNTTIIGMVGRFDSMKNHTFALDFFAEYLKSHPNTKLVFVGDGQLREEIVAKINALKLTDNVILTGIRKDVNIWMHVLDILIVPSLFEGLGGIILEAQAAGTPVVKSNTFTNEADMNIGLVNAVPLEIEKFIDAVNSGLKLNSPDFSVIETAFNKRHYSLAYEIKRLEDIYS